VIRQASFECFARLLGYQCTGKTAILLLAYRLDHQGLCAFPINWSQRIFSSTEVCERAACQ
jgi:hypothetical protein